MFESEHLSPEDINFKAPTARTEIHVAKDAIEVPEETKIYDDPISDPIVSQTEKDIVARTNQDTMVTNATSGDSYRDAWNRVNAREKLHTWDSFIQRYPEKAAAYAKAGHHGITRALERQAQTSTESTNPVPSTTETLQEALPTTGPAKEQPTVEEKASDEDISVGDIDTVITERGSTYKYLPDGRTQRFKKVNGEYEEPQSALVYVPDFDWISKHAPQHLRDLLGADDNEAIYDQNLLEYVQGSGKKCHIKTKDGRILETNSQIQEEQGPIFLTFGDKDKVDFAIPVSIKPIIGFHAYDTRKYKDESTGQTMRERHLGHRVIEIIKKQNSQ